MKMKGLGRGLDALLSGSDKPQGDEQRILPVDRLQPGKYQPRSRMDEESLNELAASIKAQGIMQPVLVRPVASMPGAERYEIVAGERRWRAAQIAGLRDIQVLVRHIPDEQALAMALIENIQRENLNPLEEALGLQRLVDEFRLTHQQAADAVGRSRPAASNLLRLLQLSTPVQELLLDGKIDMGHARALLMLEHGAQVTAASQIAAKKMSVREAEGLVKKLSTEFSLTSTPPKKEKSRDMKRVEEALSDLLMAEVEIRVKKRVKRAGRMEEQGELSIQFGSLDELNGLLDKLNRAATR